MKKVLVLCTGNSCRSQIAHGFLNYYTNDSVKIYSAGIEKHGLNINAIKCMQEVGIDISQHTSNKVGEYIDIDFDFIITVCDNANETCPIFSSNSVKIHKNFKDPTKLLNGKYGEHFISTRDKIKDFICQFVNKYLTV
ncbi:MAG: arsenate reductase ArsC [Pelagibacterales bacterium]|nr:arsenate reductase ArsC [Pelagibacterales bacterium]